MRHLTIEDLPAHNRLNLPEAALHVYKDAFNSVRAASSASDSRQRDAQAYAWAEVRRWFRKNTLTGEWGPRAGDSPVRMVRLPRRERPDRSPKRAR